MAKLLNLPDTGRSIAYSMIVDALKADATLSTLTPALTWMTYLGEDARQVPYSGNYPSIELIPFGGTASPEANTLQNSPLLIRAVICVAGLDIRDLLNLWGAFETALFPGDGSKTLSNNIRAAIATQATALGRNLGSLQTISLSQPIVKPGPETANQATFLTCEGFVTANMTIPK